MNRAAHVQRAYFQTTSRLARGIGSTQISELLLEVAGPRLCLVELERADGCFTFAVDTDWAEMGLDLRATPCREVDCSLPLPRSALRAVIAGWPAHWDTIERPRVNVHLSEDLVPHVSLSTDDRVSGRPD
ncbi:MAG: hypothetical protein KJN63_05645 [Acidimicrobiia bacterium]|nr:hypothetical protein [Acidimicrobiia bacterium]